MTRHSFLMNSTAAAGTIAISNSFIYQGDQFDYEFAHYPYRQSRRRSAPERCQSHMESPLRT